MTIAAGLLCADGLVFCSDTEVTTPAFKLAWTKIRAIDRSPFPKVLLTGSGSVDFLESVFQRCDKAVNPGMTLDETEQAISEAITDLYERHLFRNPAFQGTGDPTNLQVIAGIWVPPHECRLHRRMLTDVISVRRFYITGAGTELGRYIVDRFWRTNHRITLPQGILIASAMLMNAKRYVQGCGGSSDVVALTDDGEYRVIESMSVESSIELLEVLNANVIKAALVGTPAFAAEHLDILSRQVEQILKEGVIREQVKRVLPKGPVTDAPHQEGSDQGIASECCPLTDELH